MERCLRVTFSIFMLMLFLTSMWIATVTPVVALELVWQGDAYSDGIPVSTFPTVLETGKRYLIVATEIFWYNVPMNLAADAQYYTTDGSDNWNWKNHFPAPGGGSFLQIDGMNMSWGLFSNGDTGHTYSIHYFGKGAAITFQIVDLIDHDTGNNFSHLPIRIYYDPVIVVGGFLAPVNRLAVLAPYLALVGFVGGLSTVLAVRKRKA